MIIPLDKLLVYNGNKYEFTKATMGTFEKIGNIRDYPEEDKSWKVVPNILNLALNDYFQYEKVQNTVIEEEAEAETVEKAETVESPAAEE